MNTEHLADEDDATAHEVLTVAVGDLFASPLSQMLAQQHLQKLDIPRLAQDKRFVGALDSACNRTCAGSSWLVFYLQALQAAPKPIQDLVTTIEEDELFRFGNGGAQKSNVRYRLPMALGSTLVVIFFQGLEQFFQPEETSSRPRERRNVGPRPTGCRPLLTAAAAFGVATSGIPTMASLGARWHR